jgi:hypothetical protein
VQGDRGVHLRVLAATAPDHRLDGSRRRLHDVPIADGRRRRERLARRHPMRSRWAWLSSTSTGSASGSGGGSPVRPPTGSLAVLHAPALLVDDRRVELGEQRVGGPIGCPTRIGRDSQTAAVS